MLYGVVLCFAVYEGSNKLSEDMMKDRRTILLLCVCRIMSGEHQIESAEKLLTTGVSCTPTVIYRSCSILGRRCADCLDPAPT